MKPRVLVLFEFPSVLGGERSLACSVQQLQNEFEFLALAPNCDPIRSFLKLHGIEHLGACPASDVSLSARRSALAEQIKAIAPHLVHANSLAVSRLSGPVCQALGITSLGHMRDIVGLSPQALADVCSHRLLVAVSRATKQAFVRQGVHESRIRVLYNGIDVSTFARPRTGAIRRELNLPESATLFLNVGQISLRKGQDVLLQAAQLLDGALAEAGGSALGDIQSAYDWRLLLVGERYGQKEETLAFEKSLKSLAREPALRDCVHFLGYREDVSQLMADCDVLVHAARQEPLGRTLLEAASSKLCMVATRVGGTEEIFAVDEECAEHGRTTALLIPPDNAPCLAQAMAQLLLEKDLRRELADQAYQVAVHRFAPLKAAQGLRNLYQALLSSVEREAIE